MYFLSGLAVDVQVPDESVEGSLNVFVDFLIQDVVDQVGDGE